jgi:2-dehydropantoate 2-reductase
MNILVYGAGPLGSLFAARLRQGGHDVSILARGQRLSDLREYGIVIHDVQTDEQTVTRVDVVEQLAPDDAYDVILVIMRKNHALKILPVLAANQPTPNVLFLMNNAAGPGELIRALGKERVLTGFPSSAGYREGLIIHCLAGTPERPMSVPIGEVDGRITHRTREIARALERAPGYRVEIRTDMDAWLKYHVALLMPSLGPAMYATGLDKKRMARTRDAVVLALRAMREGFRVLRVLGYRMAPARLRMFALLPEPLLVAYLQRVLAHPLTEVALVKHGTAARDEVKHLADEFIALARTTSVPIPTIEGLYPYFQPDAPQIPDGSADIPLDWRGVWVALGALIGGVLGVVFVANRVRGRRTGRIPHATSSYMPRSGMNRT